jgi:hypothetical protein
MERKAEIPSVSRIGSKRCRSVIMRCGCRFRMHRIFYIECVRDLFCQHVSIKGETKEANLLVDCRVINTIRIDSTKQSKV